MKNTKLLVILLCSISLLSGCAVQGRSELKRSSSNKLFDMNGSQSSKRRPLYNTKYITKAKKNIKQDDYDEDDDSDIEYEDPSRRNVKMYKDMMSSKNKKRSDRWFATKKQYEPSYSDDDDDLDLVAARNRLSKNDDMRGKAELEREIADIKDILKKTREEITKAKCPYTDQAKKSPKSRANYDEEVDEQQLEEEVRTIKPKKVERYKKVEPLAPAQGSMTSVIKD